MRPLTDIEFTFPKNWSTYLSNKISQKFDLRWNTKPLLAHGKKKEDIWYSPMTKALTPTEKYKKELDNTKRTTKNFDVTIIADRFRTASWQYDGHQIGLVKPVNGILKFPLTANAIRTFRKELVFL